MTIGREEGPEHEGENEGENEGGNEGGNEGENEGENTGAGPEKTAPEHPEEGACENERATNQEKFEAWNERAQRLTREGKIVQAMEAQRKSEYYLGR